MTKDDLKGTAVILFYSALLAALIGFGGGHKMAFHYRMEISTAAFVIAGVLIVLGIVALVLGSSKKQS